MWSDLRVYSKAIYGYTLKLDEDRINAQNEKKKKKDLKPNEISKLFKKH